MDTIVLPGPVANTVEAICLSCRDSIGIFTEKALNRAIFERGPILCPGCRKRHCDYCGRITQKRLPLTEGPFGTGPFRICPLCVQKRLSLKWPEAVKHVVLSWHRELAFPEQMWRDYCLSCTPKLNKLQTEKSDADEKSALYLFGGRDE